MAPKPFGNQFSRAQAARGARIPLELLDAWERRYPSLTRGKVRKVKRPPTSRSIIQVLVYASARVLTEHGIRARHAVAWCSETLPQHFEAMLRGERASAVAQIRRPSDDATISLDLFAIVADVLQRLNLGIVNTESKPATDEQVLAEVERVQQYMRSQNYRDRLTKFRAGVAARGKPTICEEAARALELPIWVIRFAIMHDGGHAERSQSSMVEGLTTQLAGIVHLENDNARA